LGGAQQLLAQIAAKLKITMLDMNTLLLSKARTPEGSVQDILIENGTIKAIGQGLAAPAGASVVSSANLHVSAGWVDVGTHTCDPGYEHREDLASVAAAARAGGFTAIACFPNTDPALHTKSEILYVKGKSARLPVQVFPIGALSNKCEGKDLAELYDMHEAGAVAFSDGSQSVQDAGLLLRALQYAKAFGGLIINVPHYRSIAAGGQMHEGLMSTQLGLKGIPALAEELMVQRDLSLLQYAEGRLHIHLVSSAKSVDLIRAAKKSGLPVSCSVAIANLCFTDGQMENFDSNWKLMPPLRSERDRAALLEGLADDTIDFICTNHTPWHEEAKNLEFPYAEFGMSSLETAFNLYATYLRKHLSIAQWAEKISAAPRQILGLPIPKIAVGEKAELTAFDPDATWTPESKNLRSKSKNSPFLGQQLSGIVF
jgi:dihydroorotase